MGVQLRVDGHWLSSLAEWGGLGWTDRAEGGCWDATWKMHVPAGWHHPAVRRGALVEIALGPLVIWTGVLSEPDRESWDMHAAGIVREGDQYIALTAAGDRNQWIGDSTLEAIARGLRWVYQAPDLPAHANPITGDDLARVADLWRAGAAAAGRLFRVGADRIPRAETPPTAPTWRLTPGSGQLGIADDAYVTHLVGRYWSGASTQATRIRGDAAAADRWGRVEVPVDLRPRGVLTAGTVDSILDGILAQVGPRPGWANGLDVSPDTLTTIGGAPAHLHQVRAGQIVRLHGVLDENLRPVPHLDITIGEVRHTAAGATAYIEPLGIAARDFASIIETAVKGNRA